MLDWLSRDAILDAAANAEAISKDIQSGNYPLYALGRNVYSKALASKIHLSGIIDDYSSDSTWLNLPIVKATDIDPSGLVIVCSGGMTLSAMSRLRSLGIRCIDYFSLSRYGNLTGLPEIVFNEGFKNEFEKNKDRFLEVFNVLEDPSSREIFKKLVDFRSNYVLAALEGFVENQKNQYFEEFLDLSKDGEVFADVGCFDGATSLEFAKRYPGYKHIFAFEPESSNYFKCQNSLSQLRDCTLYPFGLGSSSKVLRFKSDGSASTVDGEGDQEIQVRKLDDVEGSDSISFLKIDIEGGEAEALAGAAKTISKHKPTLAISVYHKPQDFWFIPQQILSYNKNYKIYLRHYTETIYETVMFFVK